MFIELEIESVNNETQRDNPVQINVNNISLIEGNMLTMNNLHRIKLTDNALHKLLSTILPQKKVVKDNNPQPELLELFEELHKLTGGRGKTVFTLGREKKLKDLLTKHRMTRENLITAATNIGKDAFLQGENDNKKRYGDIDYLLRPDKAAKWSEVQPEKKKSMF